MSRGSIHRRQSLLRRRSSISAATTAINALQTNEDSVTATEIDEEMNALESTVNEVSMAWEESKRRSSLGGSAMRASISPPLPQAVLESAPKTPVSSTTLSSIEAEMRARLASAKKNEADKANEGTSSQSSRKQDIMSQRAKKVADQRKLRFSKE